MAEVNTMALAFELGKFPHEVEALSCDEYDRLIAFCLWRKRQKPKGSKGSNKISQAEIDERIRKAANNNK